MARRRKKYFAKSNKGKAGQVFVNNVIAGMQKSARDSAKQRERQRASAQRRREADRKRQARASLKERERQQRAHQRAVEKQNKERLREQMRNAKERERAEKKRLKEEERFKKFVARATIVCEKNGIDPICINEIVNEAYEAGCTITQVSTVIVKGREDRWHARAKELHEIKAEEDRVKAEEEYQRWLEMKVKKLRMKWDRLNDIKNTSHDFGTKWYAQFNYKELHGQLSVDMPKDTDSFEKHPSVIEIVNKISLLEMSKALLEDEVVHISLGSKLYEGVLDEMPDLDALLQSNTVVTLISKSEEIKNENQRVDHIKKYCEQIIKDEKVLDRFANDLLESALEDKTCPVLQNHELTDYSDSEVIKMELKKTANYIDAIDKRIKEHIHVYSLYENQ